MSVRSRLASLALLAAVALPLAVGCQFLVFKICVKNDTAYFLDEFAVKSAGEPTYPPASMSEVAPGGNDVVGGIQAGSYDVRATFDVADDENVCESILELTDIEIENTNLCITYDEENSAKGEDCIEIYATLDYVL